MINAESGFAEQELAETHWEQLLNIIEAETGIDLSGSRRSRLRAAVVRVVRRGVLPASLPEVIDTPGWRPQLVELVTMELTVGESFFFRNTDHVELLRERILPQIRKENQERRTLRAWSAGCAGGEEPYSLAILMSELLQNRSDWDYSVLGTDVNQAFLERGREGVFRPWSFRQTTIQHDSRYFIHSNDMFQVRPEIQRQVRFAYLNLVKDVYPSSLNGTIGLDLILFRNVAIYLKPEVTAAVLERFYHALRPGGWLLLGETEVTLAPHYKFLVHRLPKATIYQRPADDLSVSPFGQAEQAAVIGEVGNHGAKFDPLPDVRSLYVPEVPEWDPLPTFSARPASLPARPVPDPTRDEIYELLRCGRFDEVARRLPQFRVSKERAELRLKLAKSLLEHAKVLEARQQLEACLREDLLSLEAYLLLGELDFEAGDQQRAEKNYVRALYLDRQCTMAHFQMAQLRYSQGEKAAARRNLQAILTLSAARHPTEPVEFGDGICYGRLREMVELQLGDENAGS